MKKRIFLLVVAFVLFGLAVWYYFYTQPFTIAWHEPPMLAGAQQQRVQVLQGGQRKVTAYLIFRDPTAAELQFLYDLIDADWDTRYDSAKKEYYSYTDRSRNIDLGFFHYWNQCQAYYLYPTYQVVGQDQLLITLTQEAGPCGNPYK